MKDYLIDTHTHIGDIEGLEIDEIIKNTKINGVGKIVVPSASIKDFEKVKNLCNKYENVFGYIGIHPEEINDWTDNLTERIIELAKSPKIVGIGEIGLDYYLDKSSVEKQKDIFIKQIKIANEINKPINIHSREASKDTFDIVNTYNKNSTVIMHCFSGSVEFAKECINSGMYIALGGVVTFKKAVKVKEVAKFIPLERLLLETDAPYMTPEPYRGKVNQPMYVKYVAQEIANLKNMAFEEIQDATTCNAEKILRI